MAVLIRKHKEDYTAGLAGVNSCPCLISVKGGLLTLSFKEVFRDDIIVKLTAQEVDFAFNNNNTANSSGVAAGALLGSVFGPVGMVLGGLGGSDLRNNELAIGFKYNGYDTVIHLKPSPTIANLYNQLLLFKQENIDPKDFVEIPAKSVLNTPVVRWVLVVFSWQVACL
jgi:hypothetical protein